VQKNYKVFLAYKIFQNFVAPKTSENFCAHKKSFDFWSRKNLLKIFPVVNDELGKCQKPYRVFEHPKNQKIFDVLKSLTINQKIS